MESYDNEMVNVPVNRHNGEFDSADNDNTMVVDDSPAIDPASNQNVESQSEDEHEDIREVVVANDSEGESEDRSEETVEVFFNPNDYEDPDMSVLEY